MRQRVKLEQLILVYDLFSRLYPVLLSESNDGDEHDFICAVA